MLTVKRSEAIELLKQLGHKKADKLSNEKLQDALLDLSDELEEVEELSDSRLASIAADLMDENFDPDTIEVVPDKAAAGDKEAASKASKKGAKKATAKKASAKATKGDGKKASAKETKGDGKKKAPPKRTKDVDALGNDKNSQAGKINAVILKKGKGKKGVPIEVVVEDTGLSRSRVRNHFRFLVERDRAVMIGDDSIQPKA